MSSRDVLRSRAGTEAHPGGGLCKPKGLQAQTQVTCGPAQAIARWPGSETEGWGEQSKGQLRSDSAQPPMLPGEAET